jgi:hypothetical protein
MTHPQRRFSHYFATAAVVARMVVIVVVAVVVEIGIGEQTI